MPKLVEQPPWKHADDLREIRGGLSAERAAGRVGVSRQTWVAWEGGREPQEENLRRIVEVFECPPEKVGYRPPQGWELVPTAWVAERVEAIQADLAKLIEFHRTGERSVLE